ISTCRPASRSMSSCRRTRHRTTRCAPPNDRRAMIRSGTGGPAELYFDDINVGTTFDLGVVDVDRDEMLAFGRRYAREWYHAAVAGARASAYGDIIASGFYTASLFMRAYADAVLSRAAADASPGLEELRWTAPVYGGDRLQISLDVL